MSSFSSSERPVAVFDIDGVLADVTHRLHHLQSRPKDWDAFFSAACADPPLPEGISRCRELALTCEVVYLTGRPERCRRDTRHWLTRQGLPEGRLGMRADGDRRPARLAKPDQLRRILGGRAVQVIVDDDDQVCAAYARAGWPVLLATWAPPPAELRDAQEGQGRT